MLTITLGTQASGSTWLYNVARALQSLTDRPVFCTSADDATFALDQCPLQVCDLILKSHGMDQRLLKLARIANAKLIISTRDPKDSVVSQRQRFNLSLQQAVKDMSRAFATIASLPGDMPYLRYRYEDRFTETPDTIRQIADFLGVQASSQAVEKIFDSLRPESVKKQIARWRSTFPADVDPGHDPVTQWHARHVGDGRIAKWEDHLDLSSQRLVEGFLAPLSPRGTWQEKDLRWGAELFTCADAASTSSTFQVVNDGGEGVRVYGPYLCIPRGRWRLTPLVRVERSQNASLLADIHLPWEDRSIAEAEFEIPAQGSSTIALEFEHHDHFQPLEARLHGRNGCRGTYIFSGWTLRWMGGLER